MTVPQAAAPIVGIPHAGAGPSAFEVFRVRAGTFFIAIGLPGRESAHRDPCLTTVHDMAAFVERQIDRLDLNDSLARAARDRGIRLVISTDAHAVAALGGQRWGVHVARRAWLRPDDVLNARPLEELRPLLRRNRPR